jgi:hypothetical protein
MKRERGGKVKMSMSNKSLTPSALMNVNKEENCLHRNRSSFEHKSELINIYGRLRKICVSSVLKLILNLFYLINNFLISSKLSAANFRAIIIYALSPSALGM